MNIEPPEIGKKNFTCPNCGINSLFTHYGITNRGNTTAARADLDISFANCTVCDDVTIWHQGQLVYPNRGSVPIPNEGMPNDVREDYEEAASINTMSPKGAAALLRLAIQKICIYLGETGENLNQDIANLVEKGLPERIQQALDVVRVVGNQSVHPGQIVEDDQVAVSQLFFLVNEISDYMIWKPKATKELFNKLPESKKQAIQDRDSIK